MNSEEYLKRKLREELLKVEDNKLYEESKKLHEGLIYTHPLSSIKKYIEKWFSNKKSNFKGISANIRIPVEITKDGTLVVSLIYLGNDINSVNNLIDIANNYGYFPSQLSFTIENNPPKYIKYSENDLKTLVNSYNDLVDSSITFEAKFDRELDIIPAKLYHITNSKNLDKIMKIGLTPKTKSKMSIHPERIYFALDNYGVNIIIKGFKSVKPNESLAELEIDTNGLKHFRLFDDPNFKMHGVYSLMNIPPQNIKVIKNNI